MNKSKLDHITTSYLRFQTPQENKSNIIVFYRSPEFKEEQMEAIRVRLTDGAPAKRMKQVCTPGISANTIRIIGWALMNDFADEKELDRILTSDYPYATYVDLLVVKGK